MLASSKTRSSTLSLRLQPLAPASTASTTSISQRKQVKPVAASTRDVSTKASLISKPTPSSRYAHVKRLSLALTRCASSSSTSSPSSINPSAPEPTSSTTSPSSHTTILNWNEYLALRRSRRRYNLVSSVSTSLCTTATGLSLLNQNFEYVATVAALDPMVTMGIATVSSAAVGWLSGPILGSAVFNMLHRRVRRDMDEKEKDFYHRIKRYRVDPSSQSMSNPVPDYYGEKIGSVADFRNWMKDQRAYNKKRQFS